MTTPDTISDARRQLLEKFRRGELRASNGALPTPLVARPPSADAPVAPDLEQLWIHDRLAAGAAINNESFTIHKRGTLDPAILERCFNEIIRRHQIWRSAFPMVDGKAMQRIDSHVQVPLPFKDLSHLPMEEREVESVRIATEAAQRPFDLNAAPLFRVSLVRWSEHYHRIYLTVHRLVFDCVSIERVLITELAALYKAFSAGQPSPLPELAFQYSDYGAWKQGQAAGSNQAAQLEYWRKNLSGDLAPVQLSADRPRPAEPNWQSGMETCMLPAQLVEKLKEFGQAEGVTPYMILLAAFQVLLHRHSGQTELIIGGKTNSRARSEFEPLIGSFVNTIVLRTAIEAEVSFREFLGRVKSTVLGALAHSEISFDDVVRELAPQRTSQHHPFFQVLFSIRAPFADFPEDWDLTDFEIHSGASGFDLFVEFAEQSQGLAARFVYSTDLFDRVTIQQLLKKFQVLLQNLLANPQQSVSSDAALEAAPISVPAEQRQFVPPQDEIEERLVNLWQQLLAMESISVTDNYFDLGGDSLLAVRLFADIKFCFQLELPLATLFHAPTVRTMAQVIRDWGVQAASPIVPIQPAGTKPAIFCIGPVNGEVILFRRLALELGPDQPLYGLQPFSLADRLKTVQTLAASYIEQLKAWGENRPQCLLGYSFGGLVAVEMARQLRESGAEPPIVVLIDSDYLAGCKALEPWKDRLRRYRFHAHKILHEPGGFAHLTDRLRSYLFRKIHKVSTAAGVELPRIATDIRGRQLLAAENYRAKPYPGRVHLFKAESRPEFFATDPALGWGEILSDLRIADIPGDHGTITTGMNVKLLAGKLTAALDEINSRPTHTLA
jgi:thioesterase domain-containing protein/acyl carrier protein